MKWYAIPLALTLGVPTLGQAWEVDNVTCRYQNLQDVGAQTNAETNKRIQNALEKANRPSEDLDGQLMPSLPRPIKKAASLRRGTGSSGGSTITSGDDNLTDEQRAEKFRQQMEEQRLKERAELKFENTPEGCDPQRALNALRGAIAAAHMGNMETWVMGANMSKCSVDPGSSVYQDFTFFESPVMRGGAGLNHVIQINGTKIGADKLSHFMTEGYEYYLNQRRGQNLRQVIQQGIDEEEGGYGLRATGIKSYADMTANYQGYTFWRQVLDGDDPYLRCDNGKWKQVREFRWEDYVIPGMDESINCNTYKSETMQQKVNTRTRELVAQREPNAASRACPLDPVGCRDTLNAIREPIAAAIVIHPSCRKAGENLMGGMVEQNNTPQRQDGLQ